jgi:hypothetical protein
MDMVRFIESRQMRWEKHVACIGGREPYKGFTGKPEENRILEHTGTDERMILKWMLKK